MRNTFVPGSNCGSCGNANSQGNGDNGSNVSNQGRCSNSNRCDDYNNNRGANNGGCDYSILGKDCGYGCDSEPIAMAYVPWQKWRDVTDGCKGLAQGTIFNELALDFNCASRGCGNCGSQNNGNCGNQNNNRNCCNFCN